MALDDATAALVAATAAITGCDEETMRRTLRDAHLAAPAEWAEEAILQAYLFAGLPRALNAMRLWRAVSGRPAPRVDVEAESDVAEWTARGERTCAEVYGPFYERLRVNIAELHPAFDRWMITEGYGKVLGRPALDLRRRELCILAACAAAQQDRQLHSHLHGALHVGATAEEVEHALELALETAAPVLAADAPRRYRQLWGKVLGKHVAAERDGGSEGATPATARTGDRD
ncbi:MAG TPA: carboxymuconolactone decarboxylase family protein [Gemmatimonadaceae bacterium]|nr:carboxymuconolactone decarboxylase family protein [Gemmatimonadaceae bacterium]